MKDLQRLESDNEQMRGEIQNNLTYFARRAAEEEAAATEARHPVARESHLDMARRYRDALAQMEPAMPAPIAASGKL